MNKLRSSLHLSQEELKENEFDEYKIQNGFYFIRLKEEKEYILTCLKNDQTSDKTFRFVKQREKYNQTQIFYISSDTSELYSIYNVEYPICLGVDQKSCGVNTEIIPHQLSLRMSCRWKILKQKDSDVLYFQLKENDLFLGAKQKFFFKENEFDNKQIVLQTDKLITGLELQKIVKSEIPSQYDEWTEIVTKYQKMMTAKELLISKKNQTITKEEMLLSQNVEKMVIGEGVEVHKNRTKNQCN